MNDYIIYAVKSPSIFSYTTWLLNNACCFGLFKCTYISLKKNNNYTTNIFIMTEALWCKIKTFNYKLKVNHKRLSVIYLIVINYKAPS